MPIQKIEQRLLVQKHDLIIIIDMSLMAIYTLHLTCKFYDYISFIWKSSSAKHSHLYLYTVEPPFSEHPGLTVRPTGCKAVLGGHSTNNHSLLL